MSSFSVYSDAANGSTQISNQFIDQYMLEANAAQIKVYLYLYRMNGFSTSVSDMADKFNYTEKDICRALKYWEKLKLITLSYDMNGSVVGVMLCTPQSNQQRISPSFAPVTPYQDIVPVKAAPDFSLGSFTVSIPPVASSMAVTAPAVSVSAPAVNISASPAEVSYVKPAYSLDDLKAFKEQEETSQIIFIAEQYLNKTLSPADIKSLLFITDVLSFSTDLVDYLLAYCVNKNKTSFRYIETVAINWAEQGITTPEEAEAASGKYEKIVYTVMNALGKSSSPTEKEASYVKRWTNEFGFSTDIILEACERCVMSTDKNRFAYADSILKSWHSSGITSKEAISELDAKHKKTGKPNSNSDSSFQKFGMKHDYDFDAIERALLMQD